jgi:hypothetical protein
MTRRRWRRRPSLRRTGPVPAGLPGPEALEIGPRTLDSGGVLHQTLAVTGYPREVGPGWLQPLLDHPGPIDVAVHLEPVPTVVAAERLRRQLARLESSQRLDAARGRLDDPQLEAAANDAQELARGLATGQGRLVRVGLYVTVRGQDRAELDAEVARVQGLLGSLLLAAHPTTFRALQGWVTTLPLGLDLLRLQRTMDTAAVAACFPFASADLPPPAGGGVLVGRNLRTQGLVCWDRWAQPNFNQVILARSGAGKSYLAKLEALRWLYQGVQVLVVDPENEYARLTQAVGGAYLRLGHPGVHLNPLDLGTEPDALTRRALFTHTLVAVLVGSALNPAAAAMLDRAVLAAYATRGITSDPRTHPRPAPLLADLAQALAGDPDPPGRRWPPASPPLPPGAFGGCLSSRPAPTPTGTCWCCRWGICPKSSNRWGRCWPWTPCGARSARMSPPGGGWWWSMRPGGWPSSRPGRGSWPGWPSPPGNTGAPSPSSPRTRVTCWPPTSARQWWPMPPPRSCSARPPKRSTGSPSPSA